jgi:signal transduction histidine kinase
MLGSSELIDVGGEPCALSVFADITERKHAEEALASISRKLIEAQEQERMRIARELHDDINQRIAMLGIKLDVFQQSLPRQAAESQRRLNELRRLAAEIGTEVQGISHRLHSSKLEYLGLVAACRSFCREVADVHKINVNFTAENIPSALSQDVSLCLFRVLQESLSNAIKHSAAQHFEVQLRGTSSEIQLIVRDHGIGFDADEAIVSRGLGLISMRERVSVVNGMMLIASKPMRGTEITVRVPVVEKGESKTISGAA